MRDPLHQLAVLTGEQLLAVDPACLATWMAQAEHGPVRRAAEGEGQQGGGIAVIPLAGPLTPRGVSFFGRVIVPGMDVFRAAGDRAVADPNVGAIVLDVNSPGGTYAGTPETAAAVARWASIKPVIAMVDTMAASAAYFIASQANEMVVTPSGDVGSIGTLIVHLSFAEYLKKEGIAATIVRSRPGKADANPFEDLTEDAQAALRKSVDEADDEFIKAVAKGRKLTAAAVRGIADAEAARLVSGRRAIELGLADRVATMGQVLSGMVKPRAAARPARRSFVF